MEISERIGTLRRMNGYGVREFARLADVSPATISRIEAGQTPGFDLGVRLLTILGEPLASSNLADADAILAARTAINPSLPAIATDGSREWQQRWARIGLVNTDGTVVAGREGELLYRAATVARLSRRAGARDYPLTISVTSAAKALQQAGIDYAITGDAGANLWQPSATETWPVLYVEGLPAAEQALGLTERPPGTYGPRLTLIPFDQVSQLGATTIDGLRVGARAQIILDCYGGTGRMPEQADILTGALV